jgi:hypothetical protein
MTLALDLVARLLLCGAATLEHATIGADVGHQPAVAPELVDANRATRPDTDLHLVVAVDVGPSVAAHAAGSTPNTPFKVATTPLRLP